MNKYETTFVMSPDLEEEQIEENLDRIKNVITDNGGEITEEDIWGSRSLAYEIDNHRSGHYTVLTFEAEGEVINELKRVYKIMPSVLRNIVVRKED